MLMRAQLALPQQAFMDARTYAQVFTMHGTVMMFLFALPMMEGLAVYLIPKMIGARDLVFPRLSAFGYWCYLFGGLLLTASFFLGARARRRLVHVPAAVEPALQCGRQFGLLADRRHLRRDFGALRRHRADRRHPAQPQPRHDARPVAALRLVYPRHGDDDRHRLSAADPRQHPARTRTRCRPAVLRRQPRR
jgi:hypothetical protein